MSKHTFKTDTFELKQWLGKRKTSLETSRASIEALWIDTRLYFEPFLGKALIEGNPDDRIAQREDDKIYNSEPRILLHRMAAGLQSGITNQSRAWFKLRSSDPKLNERSQVRRWLDETTETVSAAMNRSNVYSALDQIYMHLGVFGTSAALLVPDDENGLHVHVIDEGAYWISQNRRGRVDTLMRRMELTVAQLVAEFGEGWLPDKYAEMVKQGKLEERVTVRNLVCPNDPDRFKDVESTRSFVSVYWLDDAGGDTNNGIVAIRSFSYNPIIAPRWAVFANSPYGIGCGLIGLGDAKQLQKLEEDKLRIAELEVDPPMLAPASMKGDTIDTGPGGITFAPDQSFGGRQGQPVTRLFETRQQLQAVLLAIESTEKRLARTFYSDLFSMLINLNMQPKQMTAREVNELSAEKVALLGPILTRLNTDLLDPLIDAVFAVCLMNGQIDNAPEELRGDRLKIEYVSSLHVEQMSSTRMSGLFKLAEFVGGLANFNPEVLDKVDFDQMVDVAAQSLTEHGVVRDDKDVDAIREGRARKQDELIRQQQGPQNVGRMAKAAKDLSETKVGTGSALDGIMGGQPQ